MPIEKCKLKENNYIMPIQKDHYVACSYDLYLGEKNDDNLIEKATAEAPLIYIQGIGMMLPLFEEKLEGLNEGDNFDFTLKPEEAYGEVREDMILKLPKSIFSDASGNFDAANVQPGRTLPMMTSDGHHIQGAVVEVTEEEVEMDFNHPLAGETLHFIGSVITTRPATDEDRARIEAMNHSSGEGCGCGCGDDCGCGDEHDCNCGNSGCSGCH